MNRVLTFVKGRAVILVLCLLIVAMLPAAYIVSRSLNRSIVTKQSKVYNDEKRRIQSAQTVTYTLPRIGADESADSLTLTRAPNQQVTDWFAKQKELREAQIVEVSNAAKQFNRDEHGRLVESFPPPDDADSQAKQRAGFDLARAITGSGAGFEKSAYELLFQKYGAGLPPTPDEVAEAVSEFEQRQRDILASDQSDKRSNEEKEKELSSQLVDRRLSAYRSAAQQYSFWGSATAVTGVVEESRSGRSGRYASRTPTGDVSVIPTTMPDQRPSMTQSYLWQWDYWVIDDLLKSVARVNVDSAGDPTPIPLSTVKRVESITIDQFTMPKSTGAQAQSEELPGINMVRAPSSGSNAAPAKTLTGRETSTDDYDVRRATMVAVVSSARLPAFLASIRSTNLMTVTDLDISEVDIWGDLAQGYFYGDDDHVVRATIRVESVWMRDWTREFMPQEVRTALGIKDLKTENGSEAGDENG